MGKLKKQIFGTPSGKIGGLVFKTRKGTFYIATAPVFRKKRKSRLVRASNDKFRFFAKLTPKMQGDPRLRAIWEATDIKGDTARHKIQSFNHKCIDDTFDLRNLKLVPVESLFPVQLTGSVLDETSGTITFAPFGLCYSGSDYSISARGVIRYFGGKTGKTEKDFRIERVSSPPVPYDKTGVHTFIIDWDTDYSRYFNYRQICLTLILVDRDGIAVTCSENVVL